MARFMDKHLCKRMFGIDRREKLSDEDFHRRVGFVTSVMMRSDYECKDYRLDYLPFMERFKCQWKALYAEGKERGCCPEFDIGEDGSIIIRWQPWIGWTRDYSLCGR